MSAANDVLDSLSVHHYKPLALLVTIPALLNEARERQRWHDEGENDRQDTLPQSIYTRVQHPAWLAYASMVAHSCHPHHLRQHMARVAATSLFLAAAVPFTAKENKEEGEELTTSWAVFFADAMRRADGTPRTKCRGRQDAVL